jgi:hypothetical protein
MRARQGIALSLSGLLLASLAGRTTVGSGSSAVALDARALAIIRDEGLAPARSEVMSIASWLTDVHGARLTGSPSLDDAAAWVVALMRGWGLDRAEREPWPPDSEIDPARLFPNGWRNDGFYLAATVPWFLPIPGAPLAWTPGTAGTVRGELVHVADMRADAIIARYGNRLRAKWILRGNAQEVEALWTAPARRFSDADLDRLAALPPVLLGPRAPGRGVTISVVRDGGAPKTARSAPVDLEAWLRREGVLGILQTDRQGYGAYASASAPRTTASGTLLPTVVVPAEVFGRLARVLAKGIPVTVEANIRNTLLPRPRLFNVVGEIRGSDQPGEVVMMGAHLDAWHMATGATDNAAGCAAVLEALRLLKRLAVPLRRTVRVVLWTGEEQGLLGSRAYVRNYTRASAGHDQTGPGQRITAYFNLDNGTGQIRGVHTGRTTGAESVFRQWMLPFRDLGMGYLSGDSGGMSDHVSFLDAGIPAWQFLQDPIEYATLTRHTALDYYERLQPEDLRRSATVLAWFVFLAANSKESLADEATVVTPPPARAK